MRLNLQLFLQGAILSYAALFRWLRPALYLASKVISPLNMMLFFVLLGRYATGSDDSTFYVIGNSVQAAALSGIYGVTMSIGGDRNFGTLPYIFGAPANRLVLFLGRALMHIIDGMLGIVVGLTWGVLLFHLDLSKTNPLALLSIMLITSFSTSGMGLLLGCLSLVTRNVMFINNVVFFLLMIFSGANLRLETLPAWMQTVSLGLPLTRGIAAARLVISGKSFSDVANLLGTETLVGLIYALLGFFMFQWFEIQAKRRGTLEVF